MKYKVGDTLHIAVKVIRESPGPHDYMVVDVPGARTALLSERSPAIVNHIPAPFTPKVGDDVQLISESSNDGRTHAYVIHIHGKLMWLRSEYKSQYPTLNHVVDLTRNEYKLREPSE